MTHEVDARRSVYPRLVLGTRTIIYFRMETVRNENVKITKNELVKILFEL